MIKKIAGIALAVALIGTLATTAMAQQVNFKFGGWFRYRGILSNNLDRLNEIGKTGTGRDFNKYYDSVFRPTFTATMEDKARVFFQLDIPAFNSIGGEDCKNFGTGLICGTDDTRTDVNVVVYNLQVKVPYVPGDWFVKIGRDNVFLPRGLVGRLPNLREFGIQVWGTVGMFKPRLETYKRDETSAGTLGLTNADDDDVYIAKLPFTPMKGLRIMPYLTVHKQGRGAPGTVSPGGFGAFVSMWYPAIEVSARFRNFFGKLDFIYQTGKIEFTPAANLAGAVDQDVSAFVAWLQAGATFGPATVSINWVYASGDGNQGDSDQKQFFAVGCAFTDGFPCDARSQGPTDMWFGDKYHDTMTVGSRNIGGNTGGTGGRYSRGNGTNTVSIDGSYKVLKNVIIQGTIGFIMSAKGRPSYVPLMTTADAAGAAAAPDGSTFKTDKYIGTEINLAINWTIYKGVQLGAGFDYLIAGNYGERAAGAQLAPFAQSRGNVNDNDDSWQAIWRLQWFF